MKILFNFKKKTIFLQVAKDCFISMQSGKRIIVPRQDLVKLKNTSKQNICTRVLSIKELEVLNACVSSFDNFVSEIVNGEVIITFEIDGHGFKLLEFEDKIELRSYTPVYFLNSLISYILKK